MLEPKNKAPAGTPVAVTPLGDIFLPIAAGDQAREGERLDKEIARIEQEAANGGNEVAKQMRLSSALQRPWWKDHRRRLNGS